MACKKEQVMLRLLEDRVHIAMPDGGELELGYLWIRDNCGCSDCRVVQTSEKKFILSDVPANLRPISAALDNQMLRITWPDAHLTELDLDELSNSAGSRVPEWQRWPEAYLPDSFHWDDFLGNDVYALGTINAFLRLGAIILRGAPTTPGALEQLAGRLGPVREMEFDRIHDVRVDPKGYNVAHTPLALPPHNDFARYSWQPTVQALHMLVNDAEGGETIVTDGFAVLEDLRRERPEMFDVLTRVAVPHRQFDHATETYAEEPLIRLSSTGEISGLRFSNQLTQMLDPRRPDIHEFYSAYHELCVRVTSNRYKAQFRLNGGQVLLVAANRVLHSRSAIESTGARHLQDAYFELDTIVNRPIALRRTMDALR